VSDDTYPVQWMGPQAVVALPEHIDVSNAGRIREQLLLVINSGAATLIADMTATVSCDHAGADAVARAYQRAAVSGAQLRLVVTAPIVRRVLSLSGLDRLVSIYPSLEAAIAAGAPAAEVLVEPGLAKTEADDQAPRRRGARAGRQQQDARQRVRRSRSLGELYLGPGDAMHIRRVVDLSLAIDADTQVYPGDPHVRFAPAATIDKDGFNLLSVEMGSQSGTNCDAPYHFLDGGARIDELDLSLFAGRGVIIDVRGKLPRSSIQAADIQPYLDNVGPGTIVVFHTGWPAYYGTTEYFDHPFVGVDACRALLERGVKTFCLDTLNIDETPDDDHPGTGFPVHRFIAQVGGVVVENLTALEQVDFTEPFITMFPLRLTGADGAPTRAVAMDLTS
jgi:anti-anti-sigma factor